MHKNLKPPIAQQRKRATRPDTNAVLACAAGMRSTALPGMSARPLRGQNLGLLCAGGQAQAIGADDLGVLRRQVAADGHDPVAFDQQIAALVEPGLGVQQPSGAE